MKSRMVNVVAWTMVAWVSTMITVGAEPPPTAVEKPAILKTGNSYSVVAEIVSETLNGQQQPVLRAGRFIIPADASGVNLQYRFDDPEVGYTSTKLRKSNLYSVTEQRYLRELESNPILALPPGEYRFEIGGSPGAGGELTMTVVPGAPGTKTLVPPTSTSSTMPPSVKPDSFNTSPPTKPSPPATPIDTETQTVIKDITGGWSGSYTVEKISGDVSGLGTVTGRRAIGVNIQPDESNMPLDKGSSIILSGAVWMPPGWFGKPTLGKIERKSIRFYLVSQPMARGVLIIDFKGTVDTAGGAMEGTLRGYMPRGDKSEELFQGTWAMKRK